MGSSSINLPASWPSLIFVGYVSIPVAVLLGYGKEALR